MRYWDLIHVSSLRAIRQQSSFEPNRSIRSQSRVVQKDGHVLSVTTSLLRLLLSLGSIGILLLLCLGRELLALALGGLLLGAQKVGHDLQRIACNLHLSGDECHDGSGDTGTSVVLLGSLGVFVIPCAEEVVFALTGETERKEGIGLGGIKDGGTVLLDNGKVVVDGV